MNYIFLWNVILYILMYLISFHLVLNSDDWFVVWLGLEVNMMMFVVLIYQQYDMNKSESCLSYFFVQSLGSGIFMSLFYLGVVNIKGVICMIMSYKIGAGPFFFWFPSLCVGISWFSCFVLLTLQKVLPLMLMNMFMSEVLFVIVLITLMVGIFGSFNQVNLSELIAYSSIFHLGWIIMCNMVNDLFWMIYMLMYMYMLFPLVYFLNYYLVENMLEVMKLKNKMVFVFLMLSMAGMPPLLGFFVKWFALGVIFNLSYYMMVILIFSSTMMFYVYFRLLYDMLLSGFKEGMWISWISKYFMMNVWMDGISILGMTSGGIFFLLMVM